MSPKNTLDDVGERLACARWPDAAAGDDVGSGVTQRLALTHPELLVGIHLTYLGSSTSAKYSAC